MPDELPDAPARRAADVIGETIPDRYISHLIRGLSSDNAAADTDDIRQDALLGFCKAALRWNPDAGTTLKTFAYSAVRGAAQDGIRRTSNSRRKVRMPLQSLDREDHTRAALRVADAAPSVEDQAIDSDSADAITEQMMQMPEPHRTALLTRLNGGLTDRAVGLVLGISEGRATTLRIEGQEWLRYRLQHTGLIG